MSLSTLNARERIVSSDGVQTLSFIQWLRSLVDQSNYSLTFAAIKAALAAADDDVDFNDQDLTGIGDLDMAGNLTSSTGLAGIDQFGYFRTNGTHDVSLRDTDNGGGASFSWQTRARISSPVDGCFLLRDNANATFDRLMLGGSSASFPALKRSGAGLVARLADDSADTVMTVAAPTAGGHAANKTYVDALGALLTTLAGLSVIGRSANSSGAPAAITGTDGQALRVSGTALGFGTIATAGVADAAVTMAKLADIAGLSVNGRSANSTGVPAAITAANDGEVLRRSGTSIGFGTIAAAGIAANAVTLAKLATQAALSVLANATNSTDVPSAVAAGTDGHILRRSGTALAFGKILASMITGTATNDNATAGDIGELSLSEVSSIGSWADNTVKNVTSLSLTAGDWEVDGALTFLAAALTATGIVATISLSPGAEDLSAGQDGRFDTPNIPSSTFGITCPTGTRRVSLAGTTTVYLTGRMAFTVGTPSANGWLRARRVR